MAEEDAIFDPALLKKKKKKKTAFDLDAALAEGEPQEAPLVVQEAESNDTAGDDLDLESFGKKKRKKKKTGFNLDDLDAALPSAGGEESLEEIGGGEEEEAVDDTFDLGMKKKKKKKTEINELLKDNKENEEVENADDNVITWGGSDRDYTYDELLNRVFDIILEKNPDMAAGRKPKFVMRPPQVLRVGTKKTSFANFTEICKTLHRQPKHLLDFLLAELGTSGSVDGNSQLIIKGRFQPKQIENVLRRYIKEYVTCHTCRSPETILQKDTRIFFLQCESCGSRCSVASIKSGFQAVTSKRAAMRAKTA